MSIVLVTGASGFIGGTLCPTLAAQGYSVRAVFRSGYLKPSIDECDCVSVGEVNSKTDWLAALEGVDCVIHCAGMNHMMDRSASDEQLAYRTVNVEGTRRLAEQAAALGVRRLIFLSSIKVHGERTDLGAPFCVNEQPAPEEPYAVSKWEAEQEVWSVSKSTCMEVVVVRLPLVYGPNVRGNLSRLMAWVAGGVPIPLAAVDNRRSMLGLVNLMDLLSLCVKHPDAAGETFLASDGQDVSTPQLIKLMSEGMSRRARLFGVPVWLLRLGGALRGKLDEIDRLTGSLQVDSEQTRAQLGWTPPVSTEDGVREMARMYANMRSFYA